MDIAAMSVVMHQSDVQQQAGISVLKMVMDITEANANAVVAGATPQAGGAAAHPYLGSALDVQA